MSNRRPKASKATVLLRLTEIWRIRLDGASIIDVAEYVAEQEQTDGSPWKLAEGETPLSRRQIERYVQRADQAIAASTRERRRQTLVKHLARREHMYARAMNAGDVRTALAVADSEAKLRGLFDVPSRPAKLGTIKEPKDVVGLLSSTLVDQRSGRLDGKIAVIDSGLAASLLRAWESAELQDRVAALEAAEALRAGQLNGRLR
jgi:hypothetical protein